MEKQYEHSNYQLFKAAVVQLFSLSSSEIAGMKTILFPAKRGAFVLRLLLFVMIFPLTAAIFFLPFVFCLLYFVFYLLPLSFNLYPLAFARPPELKNATRTPRHQRTQSVKFQHYIFGAPLRLAALVAKKGLTFFVFFFYILSFVFCIFSVYILIITF